MCYPVLIPILSAFWRRCLKDNSWKTIFLCSSKFLFFVLVMPKEWRMSPFLYHVLHMTYVWDYGVILWHVVHCGIFLSLVQRIQWITFFTGATVCSINSLLDNRWWKYVIKAMRLYLLSKINVEKKMIRAIYTPNICTANNECQRSWLNNEVKSVFLYGSNAYMIFTFVQF